MLGDKMEETERSNGAASSKKQRYNKNSSQEAATKEIEAKVLGGALSVGTGELVGGE